MAQNIWVIVNDTNDLFFTGYVGETPSWGIVGVAVTYETEAAAQAVADVLDGSGEGFIHPIHGNPH